MFSMDYLIKLPILYAAIMLAMSLDNIFWIPTSPEYQKFKNNQFPLVVEGKSYNSKLDYIFRYRILSVLKHPRDIIPAIVSSLILGVFL